MAKTFEELKRNRTTATAAKPAAKKSPKLELWDSVAWQVSEKGNHRKWFPNERIGITVFFRKTSYRYVINDVFGEDGYSSIEAAKNAAKEAFIRG
mgnify:CR=1 FL=1